MLQNLQLDLSILMIGLATLYSETETIQIQLTLDKIPRNSFEHGNKRYG